MAISIHALREEGDQPVGQAGQLGYHHFYPRPPRGGRPLGESCVGTVLNFYPRPPRGGRQAIEAVMGHFITISIHALREEGDRAR